MESAKQAAKSLAIAAAAAGLLLVRGGSVAAQHGKPARAWCHRG